MSIHLRNGIGLSLVDQTPAEIVYICLRDIAMEYATERGEQVVKADVRFIQVAHLLFLLLNIYAIVKNTKIINKE